MKVQTQIRLFICWSILFFLFSSTAAAEPDNAPEGFTGRISAGAGFVTSTDQLKTTGENKQIDALSGDADRYDSFVPLALFKLQYTFAESGRAVYLGTPSDVSGPPGLALGWVQPLAGGSRLDLSVFTNPFSEVWQDPYLTGANRKETDKTRFGARLEYDRVLGSHVNIAYSLSGEDVDEDDIGDRFEDLERDGFIHSAEAEYTFQLGPSVSLVPGFELAIGDIDGGANAYTGYRFRLGLRKFSSLYQFMLTAAVGWDDFDDRHPIFDKTRNDTNYSTSGMITRSRLLGQDCLFATLMAGYHYRQSNIDFLDARTFFSGILIGIEF
jgi:hypothetical protein